MLALGTIGDSPPNTLQPPLDDGIHLRWSFEQSLGFPWYGFFLFRRHHRPGRPLCLSQYLARPPEPSAGEAPVATLLSTPLGGISSDRPLSFTDDFSPPGQWELDLDGGSYLRLEFPSDQPARRVEVRVGFRPDGRESCRGLRCVDFLTRQVGQGPNPRIEKGGRFQVYDHAGNPMSHSRIDAWGGRGGLNCGFALEITLPEPVPLIELKMSRFAEPPTVEAFEANGRSAGTVEMQATQGKPEPLRLMGAAITRVVVRARQNEVLLHELCAGRPEGKGADDRRRAVRVTAFAEDCPVAEEWVTGNPGQVVTASLEADMIGAVSLTSGPAALVDLCFVPAFQDIAAGWEPVPEFPQPLCLPVAHSDYPCPGRPPTQAQAEDMAVARISYGYFSQWRGGPFTDLHGHLETLVDGGPPPMGQPMALRSQDFGSGRKLKGQRPLDWVMFASVHAAVAQMLGLYWLDRTVEPEQSYDYLVVADYINRFNGKSENVLRWLGTFGGTGIDGYIVFNKRMAPAAPLHPPEDVRAYVLPGSTVRTSAGLEDATNNVGLRWDTGVTAGGMLLPNRAITYLLWRAELGQSTPPAPPADGDYQTITKQPILVAQPQLPPGASVERASDWPPFPTHAVDRGLPDGWFSYRVNGIDIFGRHSANSDPGDWFQWAPAPDPRPWYYQDPPGDRSIHSFAVQVLDKVAPPAPTGVEAFALDPLDPFLQRDGAYNTWFATLSPTEQQSLIGLRVSWEWTWAHMRQAPDTAEFRIYVHAGTDPPAPDAGVATNWDTRFYVVAYDKHVPDITDVNGHPLRRYEVLLPAPGDTHRSGVSLPTSQANPIAYAHVGVSAADNKAHTSDDPKWTADAWPNRTGNEGGVGPAIKIFRVHREPPGPPPVPPADSDAIYATPADYHGHSFYTYRWQPAPNLKVHIFRAMDDAVFKTDWRQRPGHMVDPNGNAEHRTWFPSEAAEPQWNALKRQQVADDINTLTTFPRDEAGTARAMAHYRSLSNDALRVLAGLPGNERAFTQLTIQPLDPGDSSNANRLGPDDAPGTVVDPSLRAYVDTLDGRGTNRYLYRAAHVDGAHNRSHFSLAAVPVYLPNIVPPRRPRLTKILGGDRQITLRWASNREPDLAEYRVYRAEHQEDARDIRLMSLVHTEAVPAGDPAARPAQVQWVDAGVQGAKNYYYGLTAVDDAGNQSAPSAAVAGRAFDDSRPPHPTWDPVTPGPSPNSVVLSWSSPVPDLRCLVQRRVSGTEVWENASPWLQRGVYTYTDENGTPGLQYDYRLQVLDSRGRQNDAYDMLTS